MFAREGTHRGSVWCHSAASPQVLFLLEGSLSYHCACRLRLTEGCIFFLFCFPSAARGYLLSPRSFFVFTRCVWSLTLSSEPFRRLPHAVCGLSLLLPQSSFVFESVCLLSRARHRRRNPAGTTHVVRPCFQRLLVDVCTLSLVSCFVTPPCRRCTLADQANILSAVSRHDVLRLQQWSAGATRPMPPVADRRVSGIGGVLPAES